MEPCFVALVSTRTHANWFKPWWISDIFGIDEEFALTSGDLTMHSGKGDVVIVGLAANISHPNLGKVSLEVELFAVIILFTAWVRQYGLLHEVPLRLAGLCPHRRSDDGVVILLAKEV